MANVILSDVIDIISGALLKRVSQNTGVVGILTGYPLMILTTETDLSIVLKKKLQS